MYLFFVRWLVTHIDHHSVSSSSGSFGLLSPETVRFSVVTFFCYFLLRGCLLCGLWSQLLLHRGQSLIDCGVVHLAVPKITSRCCGRDWGSYTSYRAYFMRPSLFAVLLILLDRGNCLVVIIVRLQAMLNHSRVMLLAHLLLLCWNKILLLDQLLILLLLLLDVVASGLGQRGCLRCWWRLMMVVHNFGRLTFVPVMMVIVRDIAMTLNG